MDHLMSNVLGPDLADIVISYTLDYDIISIIQQGDIDTLRKLHRLGIDVSRLIIFDKNYMFDGWCLLEKYYDPATFKTVRHYSLLHYNGDHKNIVLFLRSNYGKCKCCKE